MNARRRCASCRPRSQGPQRAARTRRAFEAIAMLSAKVETGDWLAEHAIYEAGIIAVAQLQGPGGRQR